MGLMLTDAERAAWKQIINERNALAVALQAVWDECNEYLMFEPVREKVKKALGIREFEGSLGTDET